MGLGSKISGFFKKVGAGLTKAAKTVGNGIAKAAVFVYNKGLKPGYEKVLKPAVNYAVHTGDKILTRVSTLADGATNAVSGFGKLFSNPLAWIAGGAGVIYVASRR